MNAKEIRDKLASQERILQKTEFLSPYTEQSKKAYVRIDNLVYPFRIIGHKNSGFGIFKPIDCSCAKYLKEASFDVVRDFLDILPKQLFILSYQSDQGWIAFPMNLESAKKSIGLEGEAIIKGVSDCERFDTIIARFDGVNFWFDSIFSGGNLIKSAEMRECFQPKYSPSQMRQLLLKIKSITPEDQKSFDIAISSWAYFQKMSTEDRIKKIIEDGGGKFGNYVIRGANIEIKWSSTSGRTYNSLIQKDSFDVISSGICLSGHDRKFHLKDLPFIIRDGEELDKIVVTS